MINSTIPSNACLTVEGCQSQIQNEAVRLRIIDVITSLQDGSELLQDALKAGPVLIQIVQKPTEEDKIWTGAGGAWDDANRKILVLFTHDLDNVILAKNIESFSSKASRDDFFYTIIWELCNAANPSFTETSSPLLRSTRDLFAIDIEKKEFKTCQRARKLINELLVDKFKSKLFKDQEYTEDQFEEYMKEADAKNSYGVAQSHADTYRYMWDNEFNRINRILEPKIEEVEKEFHLTHQLSTDTTKQVQDLLPILNKILCSEVQEKLGVTKIKAYLSSGSLESTPTLVNLTQKNNVDASESVKTSKCTHS